MSSNTFTIQPAPVDQPPVRWRFGDLLLVALATIGFGALALLLLQVPGLLGSTALRDAFTARPLVASMFVGGLVYLLAALATYLVIVRRGRGSWREIGFRAPPLLPLLLTPLIFVAQMTLIAVANLVLMQAIGQFENPQIAALTDPNGFSWINFAFVFVVGAILAPIVEEVLFRGLLYQWLRARSGVVVAVLASGALFSVVHVVPVLLPALFLVGVLLAVVFEYTRSLWIVIALHFMQNALAICALFLIQAYPQLLPQT
jgi:uncharacterized protein